MVEVEDKHGLRKINLKNLGQTFLDAQAVMLLL